MGPVLTSLSSFIGRVVTTESACAPEGCDSALAAAVVRQESGVEEGDKPMPSLSIALVRIHLVGRCWVPVHRQRLAARSAEHRTP
jgi:hypothetical protein